MKKLLSNVFGVLVCLAGVYMVYMLLTHPLDSLPGTGLVTAALPLSGQESVESKPTISASAIDHILSLYHSPARGSGQALYSYGVRYGIDPIYALAFFHHESQYGTNGMARLTRSLGNLKCSAGYVCIAGFRAYASWQAGYLDWYRLIRTTYIAAWHLDTPAAIIPVYAPADDHNAVQAYIDAVERDVSRWRAGDLT